MARTERHREAGARPAGDPPPAEPRPRRILVATDLSDRAGPAVRRAGLLAARFGAALTALFVAPGRADAELVDFAGRRLEEHVRRHLTDPAGTADAPAPLPDPDTVRRVVRRGSTAPIVAEELTRDGSDLLVLGAHGEHGLADLLPGTGSTAENLLRVSPLPVLVVHRPADRDYRTVVFALDGGEASLRAARRAGELTPDASHLALHVAVVPGEHLMRMRGADDDELGRLRQAATGEARERIEAAADSLRPSPGRVVLTTGRPHDRVPEWAAEHDAELIAVGTGTRAAFGHALLGSVAQHVLRHSPADVLVVRAPAGAGARTTAPEGRADGPAEENEPGEEPPER